MAHPDWLEQIRTIIKQRGITQEMLTTPLQVETKGAVSHYMTGKRELSVERFISLCEFLELTPNQVLGVTSKFDDSQVSELMTNVITRWVVRMSQMGWVEYKVDPQMIIDVLTTSVCEEVLEIERTEISPNTAKAV